MPGFVKKGHKCAKGKRKKTVRVKGHGVRYLCVWKRKKRRRGKRR